MATRTPQQIRDYLAYQGYEYQPGGSFPDPEGSGVTLMPSGFYRRAEGPSAGLMSLDDVSRLYPDISANDLQQALPLFSTAPSYAQSASRGGGFFSMLTDLVTSPQFLMAGSVIAPSLLAAEAAGAAALASGAEGLAVPAAAPSAATPAAAAAPAATAFPVATSPLAPMSTYTAAELAALDAGLGGVSGAGAGANALAPSVGANALAPVFDPASALETQLTAAPSTAVTPVFDPASAMETQLTATGTPAAVSPAAAATAANAGTNALAGYGGAGDVLDPVTGVVTAGTDAATGLSAGAFDTLAKFAKDYGVPLASLLSGITGSQAAKSAADVQAQSAREARDLAKQIYERQVSLQEPFRTAGITAQNQLLTLLGLPGGTQGAEYGKYARPFSMQDFQADPGYAFRLSEGLKALEASRAAKSGLLSGSAIKAGMRYGQEMGLQEYGNAFQRAQIERANRLQPLGSLAGMGQAAAAGQAGYAGQYGQTAGGLTTDIGAARAAGDVGAANAITNALGQYARYASSQNLANQIRQSLYGAAIPV